MSMPEKITGGTARWARGVRGALCAFSATFLFAACENVPSVATFEPITDPSQLFMSLELNHRAINLSTEAPYDTLRLVATPLDGRGQPMSGLPAPTFRSMDTTRVQVSADGLLEARAATNGVMVLAELVTGDNIRHVDTAYVKVTTHANPPQVASFEILPGVPDSTVWWMVSSDVEATIGSLILSLIGGVEVQPSLRLEVLDAGGAPVSGLEVDFRSLDPTIVVPNRRTGDVTADPGQGLGIFAPGEVRIVASAWVYGVAVTDTAVFKVTLPLVNGVQITRQADGSPVRNAAEVTIRPGGYVFWINVSGTQLDVTFKDTTNVEGIPPIICMMLGDPACSGDIAAFGAETLDDLQAIRGRYFPVPGIYEYTIAATGDIGRVVVAEEITP